jgi:hypothetical protein
MLLKKALYIKRSLPDSLRAFLGSLGDEKKACNGRANAALGVMMTLSKFLGIQSRAAYKISMVDVRPLGKPEDRVAGNKRGIR